MIWLSGPGHAGFRGDGPADGMLFGQWVWKHVGRDLEGDLHLAGPPDLRGINLSIQEPLLCDDPVGDRAPLGVQFRWGDQCDLRECTGQGT